MKKTVVITVALIFIGSLTLADMPQKNNPWFKNAQRVIQTQKARQPIIHRAKNVILFISDGNGVGSNYATRLYMGQQAGGYGDEYVLPYETFPYLALAKTYATNAQTPGSAGTSTAMNTGIKTKTGLIGLSEKARLGECADVRGATVTSFAELMHAEGKSIGFVTTARITDATPAAGYAHSADRAWEDDSWIPQGCDQKDIALQLFEKLVTNQVDVAMGGGRRHFIPKDFEDEEGKMGKREDGRNLIKEAQSKGVQYAWNDTTFAQLKLDGKTPIMGLYEKSHMKYEHDRTGEPSLAEMTAAAIEYLSKKKEGYYLLVEAGRVDHANHDGNAHRMVTENAAFAQSVAKAMELTSPKDTLIIVTADHGHSIAFNGYCGRGSKITGLCYEVDKAGVKHLDQPNLADDGKPYSVIGYLNGPGSVLEQGDDDSFTGTRPNLTDAKAQDPDYVQQAMIPLSAETHSGEDVAIYARGPWAHLIDGTVEQNYIFHVMHYAVNGE
jgi:alkaline phosphatase